MGLLQRAVETTPPCSTSWSTGEVPERCTVAPKFVRMDIPWHVVLAQQSPEERSGDLGVAIFLQEDVQHSSALQGGPLQPVREATHIHAP